VVIHPLFKQETTSSMAAWLIDGRENGKNSSDINIPFTIPELSKKDLPHHTKFSFNLHTS
jgi:hypothetical protein